MAVLDLFNLEGKVALVTGGTHGIGMACGMALAAKRRGENPQRAAGDRVLQQAERAERNTLISTLNGVAVGSYIAAAVAGGVGAGLLIWTMVDHE